MTKNKTNQIRQNLQEKDTTSSTNHEILSGTTIDNEGKQSAMRSPLEKQEHNRTNISSKDNEKPKDKFDSPMLEDTNHKHSPGVKK
jgi:hypothetical protein